MFLSHLYSFLHVQCKIINTKQHTSYDKNHWVYFNFMIHAKLCLSQPNVFSNVLEPFKHWSMPAKVAPLWVGGNKFAKFAQSGNLARQSACARFARSIDCANFFCGIVAHRCTSTVPASLYKVCFYTLCAAYSILMHNWSFTYSTSRLGMISTCSAVLR